MAREDLTSIGRKSRWAGPVLDAAPPVAAVLLFLGAARTLLAAATTGPPDGLAARVPLALIEFAHLGESLAATVMLFVSAGVWRRLDAARRAGVALCALAAPLAILRGAGWEEPLFLASLALMLWAGERGFYRRSRLSTVRPTVRWAVAALAVLATAAWAGFEVYEQIPYSDALWWSFLPEGDVSRFLRALVAVALAALLLTIWSILSAPRPGRSHPEELARALALVEASRPRPPPAWLAATGEKAFLFAPEGDAMVMYAPHGDAWIAMGGPIGAPRRRRDMIWRFREAADVANAWPAFYAVAPDLLSDMLDAGFLAQKVGETALVDLTAFTLDGPERYKLRQARARAGRDGLVFSVERVAAGDPAFAEMRRVSDAWLAGHNGAEKRFSLGAFEEGYLSRFPIAMFRREGRIEAFANLWPGEPGGDLAVDLMRNHPGAPKGAMEALFVEMILWAKAQGFRRFDLGMAPLAGLEDRRFAPVLSRVGARIYRHAGSIYGFEGLRAFKNKFDPVWESRYLAAPPGAIRLSAALWRTALLTSGGLRGLLGR